MIGTIIGAIVIGLVVGGLARLVMPGKQNIGVVMTVILGAIGAFVGTWVSLQTGIFQPEWRIQDHSLPGRHRRRVHPHRHLPRCHRASHHQSGGTTVAPINAPSPCT